MQTYEYIFASIIVVAMLIATTSLASITPQLYISMSDVEQMKMVAQKLMVRLLMSPGEPKDWGGNITIEASRISSFGLATNAYFTCDAFTLDQDKVQRLNQRLPGQLYLPPRRVLELLNIDLEYGFKIEFIPVIRIEASLRSFRELLVNVTSEQGLPLIQANVVAGAFYVSNGEIVESIATGLTGPRGNCTINLTCPTPALLIVAVDYYGIRAIKVIEVGDLHTGFFIGSFLITNASLSGEAYQVSIEPMNGSLSLRSIKSHLALFDGYCVSNYKLYRMAYTEPNTVVVVATDEDGRLMAAWKGVPETYGTSSGSVLSPLAYTLERNVKIGFTAYTLKLTVWRVSW
ncbi:MAG: hypothetical protein QW701_01980 [Candidatus Nezhaarchaeales archaeon]